jgi:hypothetical protein
LSHPSLHTLFRPFVSRLDLQVVVVAQGALLVALVLPGLPPLRLLEPLLLLELKQMLGLPEPQLLEMLLLVLEPLESARLVL